MPGHGWRVSREGGDLMTKVIVSVFQCLYSLVEAGCGEAQIKSKSAGCCMSVQKVVLRLC